MVKIELPRYRSHEIVHAIKIKAVENQNIIPVDEDYAPIPVELHYLTKHEPRAGGYYVAYEDGYESYSPAEAFEAGYTRVGQNEVSAPVLSSSDPIPTAAVPSPWPFPSTPDPRPGRVVAAHAGKAILAMDEPSNGGANHEYVVSASNGRTAIKFQTGAVGEVGFNGLQIEDLIAICIDRLEGFQSGAFACRENGEAILHLNHAMVALNERTAARLARGVEGTHKV